MSEIESPSSTTIILHKLIHGQEQQNYELIVTITWIANTSKYDVQIKVLLFPLPRKLGDSPVQ